MGTCSFQPRVGSISSRCSGKMSPHSKTGPRRRRKSSLSQEVPPKMCRLANLVFTRQGCLCEIRKRSPIIKHIDHFISLVTVTVAFGSCFSAAKQQVPCSRGNKILQNTSQALGTINSDKKGIICTGIASWHSVNQGSLRTKGDCCSSQDNNFYVI